MTLVAYTGWLCLSCGARQQIPDECCPDYLLVSASVDEPSPGPHDEDEDTSEA